MRFNFGNSTRRDVSIDVTPHESDGMHQVEISLVSLLDTAVIRVGEASIDQLRELRDSLNSYIKQHQKQEKEEVTRDMSMREWVDKFRKPSTTVTILPTVHPDAQAWNNAESDT